MTRPMTPEEVPGDLVDDAVDGWHDAPNDNGKHTVLLDTVMRHVLAAVLPNAYRQLAKQVTLASAIACGTLCEACHGKPASYRYPTFRCGCGHRWDVTRSEISRRLRTHSPGGMLERIAETGVLPPMPEKIARGDR